MRSGELLGGAGGGFDFQIVSLSFPRRGHLRTRVLSREVIACQCDEAGNSVTVFEGLKMSSMPDGVGDGGVGRSHSTQELADWDQDFLLRAVELQGPGS